MRGRWSWRGLGVGHRLSIDRLPVIGGGLARLVGHLPILLWPYWSLTVSLLTRVKGRRLRLRLVAWITVLRRCVRLPGRIALRLRVTGI
jgi:hypothetical protein